MQEQNKEPNKEQDKERNEEKRQNLIEYVNAWYEDCYSLIWDMAQDKGSPRWILNQARDLVGHAQCGDDPRDENATQIRKGIIEYLQKQPTEFFDDMQDELGEYEGIEAMYNFYCAADISLIDFPTRKEEFIKAVQEAPGSVFEDGADGMSPDEVKNALIEYYEEADEEMFEDDKYDTRFIHYDRIAREYIDIYDTMRDDAIEQRLVREYYC